LSNYEELPDPGDVLAYLDPSLRIDFESWNARVVEEIRYLRGEEWNGKILTRIRDLWIPLIKLITSPNFYEKMVAVIFTFFVANIDKGHGSTYEILQSQPEMKTLQEFKFTMDFIDGAGEKLSSKTKEDLHDIILNYWLKNKEFIEALDVVSVMAMNEIYQLRRYKAYQRKIGPPADMHMDTTIYQVHLASKLEQNRRNQRGAKFINLLAGYKFITAKKLNYRLTGILRSEKRQKAIIKYWNSGDEK